MTYQSNVEAMVFEKFDFSPVFTCDTNPEIYQNDITQVLFFTTPHKTVTGGGVRIRVEPNCGTPWTGIFDWGDGNLCRVCACPNMKFLCVIANGQGYLVDTTNPSSFDMISLSPIIDLAEAPKLGVLVLHDYCSAKVISRNGVLWCKYLASDELSIICVEEEIRFFSWMECIRKLLLEAESECE